MRPKICGGRSLFGSIGTRPAAERICLRSASLRACHSSRLLYVLGAKCVSVLGGSTLRASCAGIWASAAKPASQTPNRTHGIRRPTRVPGALPESNLISFSSLQCNPSTFERQLRTSFLLLAPPGQRAFQTLAGSRESRLDLERLRKLRDGIVVAAHARQRHPQAVMHIRIVRFQSRLGGKLGD